MIPATWYDVTVTAEGFETDNPNFEFAELDGYRMDTARDFLLTPDLGPLLPRPIYRFRRPINFNDVWYFTHDESEMEALLYDDYAPNDDYVDQRDPDNWTYAGIAFCAEVAGKPNTLPVYRFSHTGTGIPGYTITPEEFENDPDWEDGKEVFYACPSYMGDKETHPAGTYPSDEEPVGTSPVYRFWAESLGCHFYTTNEAETSAWPNKEDWTYQGIAWYAFDCAGQ